jgi:hypothetical protein
VIRPNDQNFDEAAEKIVNITSDNIQIIMWSIIIVVLIILIPIILNIHQHHSFCNIP